MYEVVKKKTNQLHAVSRTQQGRQREPSVKTLRSPLSANFWRHCVLSGGTQRRSFASTPVRRNGNIKKSFQYSFISMNENGMSDLRAIYKYGPKPHSGTCINMYIHVYKKRLLKNDNFAKVNKNNQLVWFPLNINSEIFLHIFLLYLSL